MDQPEVGDATERVPREPALAPEPDSAVAEARDRIVDVDTLEELPAEEEIANADVKSRAVAGASAMVFRSFAIRAIGLLGNVVLARLLTPDDFGIVALGITIYTFANTISEGGIAAGFVRGKIAPTKTDLHAAVALQMYTSAVIVVGVAIVCAIIGTREAAIAAVMIVMIPLIGFRTPGFLHFERTLNFRPLVKVEVAETLSYFTFAIITIALGAGVWGLAIGQSVKILVGVSVMGELTPHGLLRPKWNRESVRKMRGFGIRFQGIALAALAVTQGMNVTVASVAGLGGLGIWSLVQRLLQIPLMVFSSLRRVSYPAVARLIANEAQDLAVVLRRVAKLAAVMGGVMVVGVLGASDPGVVLAFGDKWENASTLLPLSVSVVFINGPVSVAAYAYSMASGRLTIGLAATLAQAIVGPAIVIGLHPVIGIEAIAAASCANALLEASLLGWVLWDGLRVNLAPIVVGYGAMVAAAGFAGRFLATQVLPANWGAVAAGFVVSELVFAALLLSLQPRVAKDVVTMSRRALTRS